MDSESNSPPKPDAATVPRENLILTAEKFLRNPKVSQSPLEEKLKFLRKKGLTEGEVKMALERSSTAPSLPDAVVQPGMVAVPPPMLPPQRPPLATFRDVGNTIALLGGAAYGIHRLYQWWSGSPEDLKDDQLVNIEESLNEVKDSLADIRSVILQGDEIKKELSTLKGLMLSKNQFASPPMPNIGVPSWQLNSSKPKKDVPVPETKSVSNGHEEESAQSSALAEKKGSSKTGKRMLEKEVETENVEALNVNGEDNSEGHEEKKSAKQSVAVVNGDVMTNGDIVNGECCERTLPELQDQTMTATSVN